MLFLSRRQPPAPPPPELISWPLPILTALVIVITTVYFRPIVKALLGRDGRVALTRQTAYACMPCYTSFLLLCHFALSAAGYPRSSPLPEPNSSSVMLQLVLISPVIGFGLLLVSEVFSWLFISVLGPATEYAYFRHPIMGVHATTLTFYVLTYTHGAVTLEDRFGRPLYPVRYVHWFVSVSSLGHSVYLLLEQMSGPKPRGLDATLVHFLTAAPLCFATGFLASYTAAFWPAMAWCAASFVAFWYMQQLMLRMIYMGETHPAIIKGGNAPQFTAIRVAILIVWHGFPVVWVVAAADRVTPVIEHALYVGCDLLAKYLILFVSLASIR